MKNKGFTLIELLIVVAIIGILAAIILPNCMSKKPVQEEYSQSDVCKHPDSKQYIVADFIDNTQQKFHAHLFQETSGNSIHILDCRNGNIIAVIPKDKLRILRESN